MPKYEFIGKSKLARGFSYPLKRSNLDELLDLNKITLVTGVAYCEPSDEHRVLSATYYGPKRPGHDSTLTLWINAVPSRIRMHIADELKNSILTRVADWVASLSDQTLIANQMDHRLEVYYDDVADDGPCRLVVHIDAPSP